MIGIKRILIFICLTLCALGLRAQSVKWSVPPEYESLEQVTEKLYKVTTVKGVGLVTRDGKVVIEPEEVDKITIFSEGLAVAMKADKNKNYRLVGIVSEDGDLLVPPGEYYIGDYPFFSEGMFPVFNKKGAYGFLDKEGSLAVDCKYSAVHPFCQGYALVGLGKPSKNGSVSGDPLNSKDPVTYVDRNGVEISLDKSIGKITFGTSFYNDEAVVKTKSGSFATIGTNGQLVQLDVKPNLKFDWKYRLSDEKQPEGYQEPIVIDGPTTFQDNGKYGYIKGSRRILAAQFEDAHPFIDGYAVATVSSGATGILKLIDGEVTCSLERGSVAVAEKGKEGVAAVVTLPPEFKDDDINVRCFGEDHNSQFTLRGDGTTKRTAQYVLPSSKHNVEITCNGLVIYSGEFDALGGVGSITVAAATTANRANQNDEQPFVVTFTNTGKQDTKITVSISGANVSAKKATLTVKAGQKARISGTFLKVTKTEYRKITITYDDETVSKSLQVKPIFD
jgi:hypothetical protein